MLSVLAVAVVGDSSRNRGRRGRSDQGRHDQTLAQVQAPTVSDTATDKFEPWRSLLFSPSLSTAHSSHRPPFQPTDQTTKPPSSLNNVTHYYPRPRGSLPFSSPAFFFFGASSQSRSEIQLPPSRCNVCAASLPLLSHAHYWQLPTRTAIMNAPKLELYDTQNHQHNQLVGNGLPAILSGRRRTISTTVSDSDSGGEEEDEQDGSKKRKRPMNVTYVAYLPTCLAASISHLTRLPMSISIRPLPPMRAMYMPTNAPAR